MSEKIEIYNHAMTTLLATINVALSALRSEKINSDNTLNFSVLVKQGYGGYINDANTVKLGDNFFDIAYYKGEQQGDGRLLISVECEHISYRLNDPEYDKEFFTEIGTSTFIMGKILAGTGFSVGTVDFAAQTTFSLQETASRRSLLMQFAAYMGGELEFSGTTISLLDQRGNPVPTALTVGKDVTIISKAVDKRKLDGIGNPTVAYTVGVHKGPALALGDAVTLNYVSLGIEDVELRIVAKSYDPYNPNRMTIDIGNYVNSLEDDLYRIQTEAVKKDALMNGIRIGPTYGFEAVRNDKKARSYFRSDGMKFQSGDGSGGNWKDRLYYEYDSEKDETVLVFDGLLTAQAIEALKAEIDVVISETTITQVLYAEKGNISELTVDQLDTSAKVQRYLNSDTASVHYIKIAGQSIQFIQADTDGSQDAQLLDRKGRPLYWLDEESVGTGITYDETEWPVMVYVYEEFVKLELLFQLDPVSGFQVPRMIWGTGSGDGDKEKGFIYKDDQGLVLEYVASTGQRYILRLGEDGVVVPFAPLSGIDLYDDGMITHHGTAADMDWSWQKDGSGRIVSITNNTLTQTTSITWNAGNKPV